MVTNIIATQHTSVGNIREGTFTVSQVIVTLTQSFKLSYILRRKHLFLLHRNHNYTGKTSGFGS